MRVFLEVISGADGGNEKRWLGPSQVVQVGRTDWSDWTFPNDDHMSAVHFELQTDNAACYVGDLGSSNGTQVNGQPLSGKAMLRDGDRIQAGKTLFLVRLEGGTDTAAAPSASPVPAAAPLPADVRYTVETCESQLICCRGTTEKTPAAQLARLLSQVVPLYLIVNFAKLSVPVPKQLTEPDYLMDWLPEESRVMHSPIVLSPADEVDLFSLIDAGWGEDAVVCIFSAAEKVTLLEQLRSGAGVVVRPSVLLPQVTAASPVFVENLLADVDAVLVEAVSPDEWNLFAQSEFDKTLDEHGFVRASPDQE